MRVLTGACVCELGSDVLNGGQAADGDAGCVGQAVRDGCACEDWADHHVDPVQGQQCGGGAGESAAGVVQVPGPAEDHRLEEVGLYECEQGGLPGAQGREEGAAGRRVRAVPPAARGPRAEPAPAAACLVRGVGRKERQSGRVRADRGVDTAQYM